MSGKKKKKLAPVIGILNMKGGVGKTTISAHLFGFLFERFRAGTLLIDLDPQFNLTQTLFTRAQYDSLKSIGKTVYAAMEPQPAPSLFEIKTTSSPPPSSAQIGEPRWYFNSTPRQWFTIIPGDFNLVKYSLMDDNQKLNAVKKRFLKFVENCREKYKIVCIDCNPSSSFLTLCALHACTHLLVPVRPDRYSVLGLELLADFVEGIPTINPKPKLAVLLNGVPRRNYDRTVENELRAHETFGPLTLASSMYQSKILAAHSQYTGLATDRAVPYKNKLKQELNSIVEELNDRWKLGL